ncbi:methyltransferase domain-containing protein [Janibacter limosus]|uniref:Methyltransferase domain-containing protein n=2 Tax=Janibacter limosus TaxID=53458 RepID=A0AC61U8E9_9MICO|nr:methyltransferase domain-containing protein [Janibacter limosus]UUZ46405.1 methyltransferase domain-containing protein [Janibacter limosus]
MDEFAVGEDLWVERLANLRNSVRQELIARQLGEHVHNGSRVLDVGCGQGTQAIRLAQRGCDVVGVDPSTDLLARPGGRRGLCWRASEYPPRPAGGSCGNRWATQVRRGLRAWAPDVSR